MTSSMQTGHIITDLSKDAGDFFDSHHHGMELLIWIQSFFFGDRPFGVIQLVFVLHLSRQHIEIIIFYVYSKFPDIQLFFQLFHNNPYMVFVCSYYKINDKLIQLKWGHHMMTENMQNMISVNLGKMILLQSFFRLQM